MGYMLETRGLTKRFGRGDQAQDAVADVSLHIREGEVYGLLGPNGAGKSTTLKMICGMLRPTAGEILFAGHAWRREDLYAIGSLIEEAPLYPNLTARENLRVRTTLLGLPESRVDEVLAAVDLADTGKKRAGRFSMGMRQRLGLALALIARPRLLVLDEPTNGLDPIGIEELRDQIRGFAAAGTTVIVSSHILSEVQQMADTIGIICGGRLAYEDALRPGQDLEELFMSFCREGRRARGGLATLVWTVPGGAQETGGPYMRDPRHPRHFTDEFKRQIVDLYNAGKPKREIMDEYDLGKSTVERWVKSINATGSPRAADNRTPEQNRILELERENRRLRMEVDVLKQAALIYARK